MPGGLPCLKELFMTPCAGVRSGIVSTGLGLRRECWCSIGWLRFGRCSCWRCLGVGIMANLALSVRSTMGAGAPFLSSSLVAGAAQLCSRCYRHRGSWVIRLERPVAGFTRNTFIRMPGGLPGLDEFFMTRCTGLRPGNASAGLGRCRRWCSIGWLRSSQNCSKRQADPEEQGEC